MLGVTPRLVQIEQSVTAQLSTVGGHVVIAVWHSEERVEYTESWIYGYCWLEVAAN
jgi:hypothetical protein